MRRSRPLTQTLENKKKKTARRYPFLAEELLPLLFPESSGRRTLTPLLSSRKFIRLILFRSGRHPSACVLRRAGAGVRTSGPGNTDTLCSPLSPAPFLLFSSSPLPPLVFLCPALTQDSEESDFRRQLLAATFSAGDKESGPLLPFDPIPLLPFFSFPRPISSSGLRVCSCCWLNDRRSRESIAFLPVQQLFSFFSFFFSLPIPSAISSPRFLLHFCEEILHNKSCNATHCCCCTQGHDLASIRSSQQRLATPVRVRVSSGFTARDEGVRGQTSFLGNKLWLQNLL